MQHSDHGEVPRILGEQLLLLVNCYAESVLGSRHPGFALAIPGSPTVESFVDPFEALAFILFDILGWVSYFHEAR